MGQIEKILGLILKLNQERYVCANFVLKIESRFDLGEIPILWLLQMIDYQIKVIAWILLHTYISPKIIV